MESIIITGLSLLTALLLLLLLRSKRHSGDHGMVQMGKRLEQLDRVARQVEEMNSVFHSPRLRGGLGETLLEDLIRNRLPRESYSFQHSFSAGQRADAVIRLGHYKVAVDAKFPLEQLGGFWDSSNTELSKSVRKIFINHGTSIASKYILPREGTMPFALMYIPSENLYYRVFVLGSASLQEELLNMGVLPVGPSSLFVYLQTVGYGFRGFSFSSRSRELMHLISQIRKDYDVFSRQFKMAGTHLKNFQNAWEESGIKLSDLDGNIRQLDESAPRDS
ncbi:DNA recombination protein RmuC [Oceanispirochaeta crateris]|uniref:DNA recombination protein RmuC n=1 Tax=Oceanispirochaeta crateris TaxID=2518645 RepID=A0A5C1QQP4_9SPIO|nr:DNA recombination protein RmuC [Oceanispirochaeta crateris]QEN08896.1 DNA recombination protein RmuC [Oceanispirochaeta crateris]